LADTEEALLKRCPGLNRCQYKAQDGMKRWIGFGVIADNPINIGRALAPAADG
jgi:transposase, IS5 family